jgi:hypothetical protein
MQNNIEKNQYIWQRRVIGIMALALAPLSILFGLIGINTNPEGWWYSISSTYYANSKMIMMFIISVSSFFFCTYAGYDWRDRVVNLMSGVGFLGILLFPCLIEGINSNVGLFNLPIELSGTIHNCLALLAFLGFFINEMFLFTLSGNEISAGKKKRNIVYRSCACTVIVACVLLIMRNFVSMPVNTTWIAEFIALTGCGIAWLVKGEALKSLNDKE